MTDQSLPPPSASNGLDGRQCMCDSHGAQYSRCHNFSVCAGLCTALHTEDQSFKQSSLTPLTLLGQERKGGRAANPVLYWGSSTASTMCATALPPVTSAATTLPVEPGALMETLPSATTAVRGMSDSVLMVRPSVTADDSTVPGATCRVMRLRTRVALLAAAVPNLPIRAVKAALLGANRVISALGSFRVEMMSSPAWGTSWVMSRDTRGSLDSTSNRLEVLLVVPLVLPSWLPPSSGIGSSTVSITWPTEVPATVLGDSTLAVEPGDTMYTLSPSTLTVSCTPASSVGMTAPLCMAGVPARYWPAATCADSTCSIRVKLSGPRGPTMACSLSKASLVGAKAVMLASMLSRVALMSPPTRSTRSCSVLRSSVSSMMSYRLISSSAGSSTSFTTCATLLPPMMLGVITTASEPGAMISTTPSLIDTFSL
mmetsp:Transcript_15768/g.39321  ORF Transcript_15768/g.39321 Transcript_15768/m.39321 type:complete len:428 (+) Transcript_15768:214-1497(+)